MKPNTSNTPPPSPPEDKLYHLILLITAIAKDPTNNLTGRTRILGTYLSLDTAKAAANSCLFDAGYEREFFERYESRYSSSSSSNTPEASPPANNTNIPGLAILAQTPDGTTFRVCIQTTPNTKHLTLALGDGRVPLHLYYVVQTTVSADDDHPRLSVLDVFLAYQAARECAEQALLVGEGQGREYAMYVQAAPYEKDCGFGEDVVVHATGVDGENYLVSVLRTEELDSVRVAEEAGEMAVDL
ncbi:uncharacterized protein BO97DRAFT_439372 [Aspergillus homomorphus CBS 101889]|uniref:Uncharacterized protein n=1 Tax=Aspergillus homomorphus (strain CBS 101889) TaxID=1450537 RepID=A0A395IBS1_ASPHC|nr:hypothetical protein BO97DRAFT_439372 [Aspergillus homomorphus CBS 101889]RAL17481.1 hypothetical protein BO97DRAFT_439372 [Aspergillus homomorphus CBS 101889]